jgi:hypothetical protein
MSVVVLKVNEKALLKSNVPLHIQISMQLRYHWLKFIGRGISLRLIIRRVTEQAGSEVTF